MKRKLSALLALVLAVVMVFPTAVFAAEGDAPGTAPTNPVIEKKNLTVDNKDATTGTISLIVGQSKEFKLDTDATVVDYRILDTAIATVTTSDNKTFTVTGRYPEAGETQLEINLKKEGEAGTTPATATVTATVSCVAPEVAEVKFVSATVVPKGSSDASDAKTKTSLHYLQPGDTITGVSLNVKLNNDTTTLTTISDVTFSTNQTPTKAASVQVRGGDRTLYINFKATYTYGTSSITFEETHEQEMSVEGKSIESITVEPVSYKNFKYTDNDVDEEDLVVTAKYNDDTKGTLENYTLHGIYTAANANGAITKAQKNEAEATDFTGLLRNEKIYIVVEYDGVYGTMDATLLDFTNMVPTAVEITELTSSAVKKYVDGQTFGEFGFNGVKLSISYEGSATPSVYVHDNGDSMNPGFKDLRGTLTFDPFVAGEDKVSFTYVENNTKVYGEFSCANLGISVEKKQVESLDIANKTGVKVDYKAGEKLNLDGLTLKVTYNNGLTEDISYANPAITYNPKQNDALTEDITFVLFVYKYQDASGNTQEKSCKLPITVKKDTSTPTKQVTTVLLNESYNAKKDYFIGEAFQADGFSITVVYNDGSTVRKDLEDCFNFKVNNTRYYDNDDKQFTRAMVGSLEISFTLSIASNSPVFTVTISDITAKVRPVLKSITVSSTKDTYMEGDAPRVCDFKIIAKYDDDTTRVFEVDDDVTTKTSYTVTTNNVTYTVKVSPTSITADTETIRVTYSEKVSGQTAKSAYADYEIEEVTVPEAIMRYYDTTERSWLTKSYEDFYDALEDAEEIMDDYSSVYASRIPEIQLRKDVVMLSDFTTTETMEIDLNGHSITMIRGDISVSTRAATGTEVRITNSDRTDGKLIFSSDDEDTVLIAYNDIFTIDEDSVGAGKYDITITAAKNGKVTGPDEVTHGHDAQFTITPDEGYEIATIKVNNKTVAIPAAGEKLTVKDIQAKQTITVTFKEKAWDCPFTDIYKSATYYKSIQFVYENELFQGTSATKFEPDTTMTRAMFVTVLGRLAEVNVNNYTGTSFTDVKNSAATSWYVPYVEWASSIGLVEGYGNGKFGPDDPITHAQMYVLMQRYALLVEKLSTSASGTSIPANDVKDIPDWAIEAVRYAAKKDFLVLSANRLTPNANAKRSELAVLLDDFCHNVLAWDK